MKTLDEVNKLIEWFESNSPKRGQTISVNLTPAKLAQLLGYPLKPKEEPPVELPYRGRTLRAIGREAASAK